MRRSPGDLWIMQEGTKNYEMVMGLPEQRHYQALATELVHAATCTPGLVEVAQQSLGLPARLVVSARAATGGIDALLKQLAPIQA